ncbi:DUF4044 domain-containing protein [Carnobacterium sp.]
MANKKDTKQTNTTKKLTKIFVWIMLFSMIGTVVIPFIFTLLTS